MISLIAMVLASLAGFLPHLLLGDRLGVFGDFLLGSIVGGVVYVIAIYQLKKMRGDF